MKTYYIEITETRTQTVEVHAENVDEALFKAENAYDNSELDIEPNFNNMYDTQFNDVTEETINNYEFGGMPKFYEIQ